MKKLLKRSAEGLDVARNENGRAYLERDMGLVALLQGDLGLARTRLREAIPQFIELNDHRGLAPVFIALSSLEILGVKYDRARRYALGGAVLQPYSYLAVRVSKFYEHSTDPDFKPDVEDLHMGKGSFRGLPSLLERVNSNSGQSAYTTINRTLQSLFPRFCHLAALSAAPQGNHQAP